MTPGISVFDRMPCGPYSTAMWSLSMFKPAFETS
jgi:hypothetical protein